MKLFARRWIESKKMQQRNERAKYCTGKDDRPDFPPRNICNLRFRHGLQFVEDTMDVTPVSNPVPRPPSATPAVAITVRLVREGGWQTPLLSNAFYFGKAPLLTTGPRRIIAHHISHATSRNNCGVPDSLPGLQRVRAASMPTEKNENYFSNGA
jgi:hypothetical protein